MKPIKALSRSTALDDKFETLRLAQQYRGTTAPNRAVDWLPQLLRRRFKGYCTAQLVFFLFLLRDSVGSKTRRVPT